MLQVSLAGILSGTAGLAAQLIRHLTPATPMAPLTISVYRTAIAALVLFGATARAGALPQVRGLLRERPVSAVAVGTSMAAYQGLYFFSVTWVGVTVSTVVSLGVAPLLLTVADAIRTRARPTFGRLLVLAAALAGLVLVSVSPGGGSTGPHPVAGVLAAIGAGASFAVTAAAGRTLARSCRPLALTTAGMAIATCVLVPIAVLGGLARHGPAVSADPRVLGWLVYLGVATMALAYALLYAGLRTVSGSSAVIVALLEPVTAAVAAALFLGERIGPLAIFGTVLILAAVAGLERGAGGAADAANAGDTTGAGGADDAGDSGDEADAADVADAAHAAGALR